MSVRERLLEDLRAGMSVTPLTALERYGCLSLSQRISELRAEGFVFVEETVTLPNKKKIKKFTLGLEPLQEAS